MEAGFTCTDLCAAIIVLALLALVFLPRVQAGRDQTSSTRMRCLWNQRQLIQSIQQYADDNQGAIISSAGNSGGGFWPGPQPNISSGIPLSEALLRVRTGIEQGVLWKYQLDHRIYHCPGDRRFENPVGNGWGYDSYAKMDGMNGGDWMGQVRIRKFDAIPEPSLAIVFIEEAGYRGYNLGTWVANVNPPGWVDVPAIFHDTSSTLSYADGRVELHNWTSAFTIDAGLRSAQGNQITFAPPASSDLTWVLRRYKHQDWTP